MDIADLTKDRPFTGRVTEASGGCWIYTGARHTEGYGLVGWRTYGTNYAHRVAYQRLVGPIPDGLQLDHLCRTRPCVRPAHLEPVAMRENIKRGRVGKLNHPSSKKTHCPYGHAYSPENTRFEQNKSGFQRRCKTCYPRKQEVA